MRRSVSAVLSAAFLVLAAACNRSDNAADERWPDTGNFQYNMSVGCETGNHAFGKKSDYCIALTDRAVNGDCAVDARRQLYSSDCGSDFAETDIPAPQMGGFDEHLQRDCSIGRAPVQVFAHLPEYCTYLSNENLHQGCLWVDRKAEFTRSGCPGDFSAEPAAPQPDPTPTATPEPTATPQPTPVPSFDSRPTIVKELEAAGIKVTIQRPSMSYPMPGEASFDDQLNAFYDAMEANRDALIADRSLVDAIYLTDYGTFEESGKFLTLCVALSADELHNYLDLVDRRVAWERQNGMTLYFGVDIFGSEGADKLVRVRNFTQEFTQNPAVAALRGTVKSISIKDYTTYTLYSRELQLDEKSYADDLAKYGKRLAGTASFFQWADANGVVIAGDLEVNDDAGVFQKMVSAADAHRDDLLALTKSGNLKGLEFSNVEDKALFYKGGSLTLASRGAGLDNNSRVIEAIRLQFKASEILGYDVTVSEVDMDANYLACSDRLKKFLATIKSKGPLVKTVFYSATSGFDAYGYLTIGYNGTDQDLEKILADIHG